MQRTTIALLTVAFLIGAPTMLRAQDQKDAESVEPVVDAEDAETENELARLELEREKELDAVDAENEKAKVEIEQAIAKDGETKKLREQRRDLERKHAGERMRIERDFAEKRQKMIGKKRGATARQMAEIEESRTVEAQAAEDEFQKELAAAKLAAKGDEREFDDTRGRLRRNRNEKLDKIERKFGEKRRKLLEKKGKLHPHDAEEHPGKGPDGERGKSDEHRKDGEKRGQGRDDDDKDDEPDDDDGGDEKGKGKGKGGGKK